MHSKALKTIPDDYVSRLENVVAQRERIVDILTETKSRDLRSAFFVGSGSSYYNLGSAWHALELDSSRVAPFLRNSSNMAKHPSPLFGPACLLVAASESGQTPETLTTVRTAQDRGALTLAISAESETPFARAADQPLVFESSNAVAESVHILSLMISYQLMETTDVSLDYETIWGALNELPAALRAVLDEADDGLADIAQRISANEVTLVLSGGPNFGVAAGARRSFLTEPKHIEPRYSEAESVHGAFDAFDEDMHALVYLGEDTSRDEMAQVYEFAKRHSRHTDLIDSRTFALPGIDEAARAYVTPVVLASLSRRLSDHIAAVSGHDSVNY